jgi:hypothetical protein
MHLPVAVLITALLAAPPAKDGRAGPQRLRIPAWTATGETIRPESISARLNGHPAKVLRVQNGDSELIILLVLDLVGDLSLVDPARAAIIAELEKLPAHTYVGVMRSQDGLKVLADPTNDRAAAVEPVRQMPVSGRAGLLDTVELAARIGDSMLSKSRVRVAVLYVTDSHVGNYRADLTNPVVNSSDSRDMSRRFPEGLVKEKMKQVLAKVLRYQPPLFIVHVDYQNDRLNEAYRTGLLEMAALTGGNAEFCRSVADIPKAIERTFASIAAHSSIELEWKPARTGQVDILLSADGTQLRYRTRLLLKDK